MKHGDPRIREVFVHIRRFVDLMEDIVSNPQQVPEPPRPPERTPEPKVQAPPPQPPPVPVLDPLLVTIKENQRLIGISRANIYRMINDGRLDTVSIGKRRLIRYPSLRKFAEEATAPAPSKRFPPRP